MRLRWKIGRIIAYILAKTLFGFRVSGQHHLVKNSGQLLVANHRSNIDPFFVGLAAGQEIYFMAKQELFNISKFFSWLISFWNAIPLARDIQASEAIRKCATLLKNKRTVLIFPEGTRNKYDEMLPFKPGFGFLAITNQVPIVPVAISGVREVWHGRFTRLIDRDIRKGYNSEHSKNVIVTFGKPISPLGFTNTREDYERLSEVVQNNIKRLLIDNE
jgi:1-acyl-sn-glycerol-3-phosphate acyltransferase